MSNIRVLGFPVTQQCSQIIACMCRIDGINWIYGFVLLYKWLYLQMCKIRQDFQYRGTRCVCNPYLRLTMINFVGICGKRINIHMQMWIEVENFLAVSVVTCDTTKTHALTA